MEMHRSRSSSIQYAEHYSPLLRLPQIQGLANV